ncbi:MAG TPA: hypothetical protein VG722_07535, partial [Tepidisphaeraceae bacterium]|nr:hypothetical protein [Tepidisphaeraceae bacterium]
QNTMKSSLHIFSLNGLRSEDNSAGSTFPEKTEAIMGNPPVIVPPGGGLRFWRGWLEGDPRSGLTPAGIR